LRPELTQSALPEYQIASVNASVETAADQLNLAIRQFLASLSALEALAELSYCPVVLSHN
jgi:hypothetical protein